MLIPRAQKLEQILTDDCKKAIEEINRTIRLLTLTDWHTMQMFDAKNVVDLSTILDEREEQLVKEILLLSGWKNVHIKDNRVSFYF